MICLVLIMTMIFINNTGRAEQKIRHSDTLLKEEDMNAKTKAWLLMVESGKVDQEELRRITPKSIFIAPLLTSRIGKCKEGYRHDHLGQCVKVIKIDPKVQLELLLQRLNKLYGKKKEEEKKEEKEEAEFLEVSNGPLHFSLPISIVGEKVNETNNDTKLEDKHVSTINTTISKIENFSEVIPIPLPMVYMNETNQTKKIESPDAEPLKDTEEYGTSQIEGSGDEQTSSGDDVPEEETTTKSPVTLLSEETDYFDVTETDLITVIENQSTTEAPINELPSTKGSFDVFEGESYQNKTNTFSVNDTTAYVPKENIYVQKEMIAKNNSKSDRIHFPSDDDENYYDNLRTPLSSLENSRIKFPDEVPESQVTSYRYPMQPDLNTKPIKYGSHSSIIPREQFWWLPKNWQVDETQQRSSALIKVWSRLPLMHDITYSHEIPDGLKKSAFLNERQLQNFKPQYRSEEFPENSNLQRQPQSKIVKPFRRSRFQEVILTPGQNFRLQR